MEPRKLPKGHVGLTRRSWSWIQEGLARCAKNPEERQLCLEWCKKFPDYTTVWAEILEGKHKEMVQLALRTEDYFDLSPEAMAWWERIIQNHPFAVLYAREAYAALLKKREKGGQCE